jgi:hypothetical protein
MTHNENGPKWARAGLVLGVLASVVGNVANAFLTETTVSIVLRAPLAVVWPAFLFVAVEVLVRNRDSRGPLARMGQAALLTVTVPTAITSFLNLHALMVKANEPGMAQLTGPLAIDGVMLGCTIMLLAVRVRDTGQDTGTVDTDKPLSYVTEADTYTDTTPVPLDTDTGQDTDVPLTVDTAEGYLSRLSRDMDTTPVPAVPVSAPPVVQGHGTRSVRPSAPDALDTDVRDMLSRGVAPADIKRELAVKYGKSTKTVGRRFPKPAGEE